MIRVADVKDAAAVRDIWNRMVEETLATFTSTAKTESEIEALISGRPGAFFVAEDQGRLVGFVTFGSFRSGDGYARTVEHTVVILPAHAGQGIGRMLMNKAIEAAAKQGKHVMIGAISGANPEAVAFHESLGFERSGHLSEVGWKRGKWLDLVLMQKMLPSLL